MVRIFTLILLFPLWAAAQTPSAQEVLNNSIRYHDPQSQWAKAPLRIQLRETRPGAADRETSLVIDLTAERFVLDQLREGNRLVYRLEKGACLYELNGHSDLTEEEIKTHRLNCDRAKSMRDFYTYLWGLPMKLHDPGTIIGEEVLDTRFNEQPCWGLRVTYSPEVGKDTWYFYFAKDNYALIGYRFYHDEAKNDGEYIILEEEATVGGFRLPRVRKWYTHGEEAFLGSDELLND